MVIMYRGVFTVGIAVIEVTYDTNGDIISNALVSDNAIGDYSYINARGSTIGQIARCVTGLGPSTGNDNNDIGSFSFNGTNISFGLCGASTPIVQPRGAGLDTNIGIVNIGQCRAFATTAEGVYTCTMINSLMEMQSVRFGVYFTERSESLIVYISHHLIIFHLSTQLLQ